MSIWTYNEACGMWYAAVHGHSYLPKPRDAQAGSISQKQMPKYKPYRLPSGSPRRTTLPGAKSHASGV